MKTVFCTHHLKQLVSPAEAFSLPGGGGGRALAGPQSHRAGTRRRCEVAPLHPARQSKRRDYAARFPLLERRQRTCRAEPPRSRLCPAPKAGRSVRGGRSAAFGFRWRVPLPAPLRGGFVPRFDLLRLLRSVRNAETGCLSSCGSPSFAGGRLGVEFSGAPAALNRLFPSPGGTW